jgi:hypothetical protein
MQPIDIADSRDRFQWETLRALGAPRPDPSRLSDAALAQLGSELVELHDDRLAITPKGRPGGRLRLAAAVASQRNVRRRARRAAS